MKKKRQILFNLLMIFSLTSCGIIIDDGKNEDPVDDQTIHPVVPDEPVNPSDSVVPTQDTEKVYTTNEIINILKDYKPGEFSKEKYYVKGTVLKVYSNGDNLYSFYLQCNNNVFEVYNCYVDTLLVPHADDVVKFYGYATIYNGKTLTYELAPKGKDYPIICQEDVEESNDYYIVSLNDFHGAVEKDENGYPGLGRFATILNGLRDRYGEDHIICLSAGDNYQGSLLSNMTRGKVIVDCLNQMEIDGTTIGNHEFDWGLEEILKFYDKDLSNGEAKFAYGCANLYYKNGTNVESIPDYFVINKGDVKIGVIPTIGEGLELSILSTRVADYKFIDPKEIVPSIAYKLRKEEGCNIVVVDAHERGEDLNEFCATLDADHRVDCILNGHTHTLDNYSYSQSSGYAPLVSVQSSSSGQYYGLIKLTLDDKNEHVINAESSNNAISTSVSADTDIEYIIADYVNSPEVREAKSQILANVGENLYSKSQLYQWVGSVIQESFDVDVGISNQGGLRTFNNKTTRDNITFEELYALYPFDNCIYTVEVSGQKLKTWIGKYGDANIVCYRNSTISNLEDTKTYKVAITDYVAEKTYSQPYFVNSSTYYTNIYLRDLLKQDIQLHQATYGGFYPSRGALVECKN